MYASRRHRKRRLRNPPYEKSPRPITRTWMATMTRTARQPWILISAILGSWLQRDPCLSWRKESDLFDTVA